MPKETRSTDSTSPNIIHWDPQFKSNFLFPNAMSNTLVNLKVCIPEFNSEALLDDGVKIERCWRQWLENFECCISFEGVTDQSNGLSKKSCLSCHQWPETWEVFSTVTTPADMYEAAMTILPTHFTLKKNLTAERFEFFCTKPINSGKTHDHWITKVRTKVKDC